jgi:hypothetical protein
MLKRLGLLTWGVGARINNGQAKKHAADVRARMLAPTIAEIQKTGLVSINAITRELRNQGIATAKGGKWHPGSVRRLLLRLEKLKP